MGDKPAANALMADGTARAKAKWKAEYTFAEQLMVRREYKDALTHLQVATKSKEAPVMAWKMLGHAYEKTGNTKNSLAAWEHVVARFPDDVSGPVNLNRIRSIIDGTYKKHVNPARSPAAGKPSA